MNSRWVWNECKSRIRVNMWVKEWTKEWEHSFACLSESTSMSIGYEYDISMFESILQVRVWVKVSDHLWQWVCLRYEFDWVRVRTWADRCE